jgi:protein import protein ZIM17
MSISSSTFRVLRPISQKALQSGVSRSRLLHTCANRETTRQLSTPCQTVSPLSHPRLRFSALQRSYNSTRADPSASVPTVASEGDEAEVQRDTPSYELTFTCKPCLKRSTHRISKQGYHRGSVLITCPQCKNRHVISDHLQMFSDQRLTIEDILKEKGEVLKKGSMNLEGDIEFWDDGTTRPRKGEREEES